MVSGQAEADFDLGMKVNLDASHQLLEAFRAAGHCPRVDFTSSIAAYCGNLPDVVRDDTALGVSLLTTFVLGERVDGST